MKRAFGALRIEAARFFLGFHPASPQADMMDAFGISSLGFTHFWRQGRPSYQPGAL